MRAIHRLSFISARRITIRWLPQHPRNQSVRIVIYRPPKEHQVTFRIMSSRIGIRWAPSALERNLDLAVR
jgi:hypothetical protein